MKDALIVYKLIQTLRIALFILITSWIFHPISQNFLLPSSETITCNNNYVCYIEQTYKWKTKKTAILLDKSNSYIYCNIEDKYISHDRGGRFIMRYRGDGWSCSVDLELSRIKPFELPIKSYVLYEEDFKDYETYSKMRKLAKQNCDKYAKEVFDYFKNYMKNPQNNFFITSTNKYEVNIFRYLLTGIPLLLFWLFVENLYILLKPLYNEMKNH